MKLKVEKERLLRLLSKVQGITDRKSTMAILATILFEAKEGHIHISATDLEIGFRSSIEAKIEKEGALAIPARKFYEIIKDFPLEEIYLEEKEPQWLTIFGKDSEIIFRLATLQAEDFPTLPEIIESNLIDIPGEIISEMISKTIFCVSTEETHFILSGIYIEKIKEGPFLRFVATDGHRLAMIDREIESIRDLDLSPGIIIPRKAAQEIKKIAQDDVLVQFGLKENHVIIATTNEVLITRLIDGQYPDYRAVIPKNREKLILVFRKPFIEALKRISIISSERYRPIRLEFSQENLIISSYHPDIGEGREKLSITYKGEPFSLNFNAKYLIDILDVMDSEEVELCMNNETTPCIITGASDQGFLGLVMPMTTR